MISGYVNPPRPPTNVPPPRFAWTPSHWRAIALGLVTTDEWDALLTTRAYRHYVADRPEPLTITRDQAWLSRSIHQGRLLRLP